MPESEYIRLAKPHMKSGVQVASSNRSSLWLGKDHLLCVETTGYTETYKRFFFRDIQVFTLHRTSRRLTLGILLSLPIVGCLTIVGFAISDIAQRRTTDSGDVIGLSVLGGLIVLFGVPFILNLVRGPGCVCTLRTAVQDEEIPAIKRVQQAEKIFTRVRPLIAEAQGTLTREELPARLAELANQSATRLVVDDPNLPPRMIS
ncbi:MAG: hypothetical protein RLY20_3411 [Verrucomicrobiota bacterium]|jgi:hypothetical protein